MLIPLNEVFVISETLIRGSLLCSSSLFRETAQFPDAPGQKSLAVSVTTRPCLKPGANPFKYPRIAIYLRPTREYDYFTLVKERSVPIELPDGDARYCQTG